MIRLSFFGPKKTDFYDEQIVRLKNVINELPPNSEEWNGAMENLLTIQREKREMEEKPDYSKVIQAITSIGALGVSIAGLGLTYETAKMAYVDDEQMRMKNGNVWRIKDEYRNYYKTK